MHKLILLFYDEKDYEGIPIMYKYYIVSAYKSTYWIHIKQYDKKKYKVKLILNVVFK